jgi:putative phosphoribosyl transferase
MRLFRDRRDAGQRLAARLEYLRSEHPIVLGLPRGGVPVAFQVARALDAPLDVIVVRKLGVPFQPELGMGAIGEDGARVLNDDVIRLAGIKPDDIAKVEARERAEVERRARRFRGERPMLSLEGRTVIIVDDGIATGGTARAALKVARVHGANRVVLAVPVAPPDTVRELVADADEVVCLETPAAFSAIGAWYADFSQTPDEQVTALLAKPAAPAPAPVPAVADDPPTEGLDEDVEIPAGPVVLSGHLSLPASPLGVVVFAHGSGSSRHSPRNRFVARVLNEGGLGTLLFDLLTVDEELDRANVFDVELLAERLTAATAWLEQRPEATDQRVGYFGASTGAAAALWSAADPGARVAAIVSRGGRPDLAAPRLAGVRAPTLLIVGGHDDVVLELNRDAARQLRCEHHLEVVPGATHLFEEPGTLEAAARLARQWFSEHLTPAARRVT